MLLRLLLVAWQLLVAYDVGYSNTNKVQQTYCQHVMAMSKPIDLYQDNEGLRDRERIGDLAVRHGLRYLALKVSLDYLPLLLQNRYLPTTSKNLLTGKTKSVPVSTRSMLLPVGPTLIGQKLEIGLGGINVVLDQVEGQSGNRKLAPNPNQNAYILYSPRILSLTPWTYGNAHILDREIRQDEAGGLCLGRSCIQSSNSLNLINEALLGMAGTDRMLTPWKVRSEGPLPRYEILGILVNPSNEKYAAELLDSPGIRPWTSKLFASQTLPSLGPYVDYDEVNLKELARDLSVDIDADKGQPNTAILPGAVLSYTNGLPGKVRNVLLEQLVPGDLLESEVSPDERPDFQGLSQEKRKLIRSVGDVISKGGKIDGQKIPKLVSDAKIYAWTRLKVSALRDWHFLLAEYRSKPNAINWVLISVNESSHQLCPDIPIRIWGVADASGSQINWIFVP